MPVISSLSHRKSTPAVIGGSVFLILLIAVGILSWQRYKLFREAHTRELTNAALNAKDRLKAALDNSSSATRTLAFLKSRYTSTNDFDSVAKELLDGNTAVDALELVQGGTIIHVYPFEENKAAIGYNILDDSLVSREAMRTISDKKLFYAGPLQLRQGYTAIVGRLPIIIDGKFWGFAASIIKLSTLVEVAELDSAHNPDYRYQLSKKNPNTGEEQFFLPQTEKFQKEDWVAVYVEDGDWQIYARYAKSHTIAEIMPFIVLGLLFAIFGGWFASYSARQPYKLQQQVAIRTRQLNEVIEQLQVRKQQLHLFIAHSPAALAMFDREMRYIITSRRWLSDYGLTEEQVIGKTYYEVFPEVPEQWKNIYKQCLQGVSVKKEEDHYTDKNGKTMWLRWEVHPWREYNGEVGGIIQFTEVITKLKEAEIKFRNLVEKSLAGVFIIQDGKVVYINPAEEKILGYSLEEFQALPDLEVLVHKDDIASYHAYNKRDLNAENSQSLYGLRAIRKDGTVIYLELTTSEIMYEGRPALLGTVLDITNRVEEEIRIDRAVNDAQERERMQIGMELHDNVKQIMAAALLTVDYAKSLLTTPGQATTLLDKTSTYITESINELRRLSHQLAPTINKTDSFSDQVKRLVAAMNAGKGLSIFTHIGCDDINFSEVIRTALYRILQEQMNNIFRYANASVVKISLQCVGDDFIFSISDNGQGFDPTVRGEGIGLENIRRRAFVLGGAARITSAPGKGCEVRITIPVHKVE